MLEAFEGLSAEERQLMYDAVPLVAALIAGADGKIDDNEKEWAAKLTHIRGFSEKGEIADFYENLGQDFDKKLDAVIAAYPSDSAERTAAISAELAKLNDIFPKLNYNFAKTYHKGLQSFAKHVAKASGGILGMMSISAEEKELLDLPMIKGV